MAHYAILVNRDAGRFQEKVVKQFTSAVKAKGGYYSIYEPASAMDLLKQAEVTAGVRRPSRNHPAPYARAGQVTALVACGGDGTVNLVGRAALKADLPLGILPMGIMNNIGRSLCDPPDPAVAIDRIIEGRYRAIDSGIAAEQVFFGSVGLGFIPHLAEELDGGPPPRTGLGWSRLAARAAAQVRLRKTILKVDSVRFELSPIILNVNLLSYSVGLPLSPASLVDDGCAEIIIDHGHNVGGFSSYARQISKKKYLYGSDIRLFRGRMISCQPMSGRPLYLDGEVVQLPAEVLDVQVGARKLKVFC
ncbi:MAG: hypothetical protein KKA42_05600 [candidate division Zixibacteria bacterium]|nr:hypothetical protein [candidate division Zixibacteria bacterium]